MSWLRIKDEKGNVTLEMGGQKVTSSSPGEEYLTTSGNLVSGPRQTSETILGDYDHCPTADDVFEATAIARKDDWRFESKINRKIDALRRRIEKGLGR